AARVTMVMCGLDLNLYRRVLELFLKRIGKGKKRTFFSSVFSLLFIWLYAFVTGFSASVLRAVVMFSFFSIGKLLMRQNASYNVLAVSAFCLLCYDPYMIMQVGFQLSYLAVFGIIYLHPRIHRLLEFESVLMNWIWTITSISIAAQIATSPLAIYYFHQFPVYFLFTNLLIIPVSTIILYGGLSVLFFGLLPVVGNFAAYWLGIALNWGIWFMNTIIFFFESLPFSILNGIDISRSEALFIYCIIALLLLFIEIRKLKYLVSAAVLTLIISVLQLQETKAQQTTARFAVYAVKKQSAVEFLGQGTGVLATDTSLLNNPQSLDFFIRKNWWSHDVNEAKLLASDLPAPE
ncbi:MAG: ComEC/Rec2 family competence protein, partial [Chitinophagaceae bacterium]